MKDFELIQQYEPPENATMSVIAVQGLWANRDFTWSSHGVHWLRDLLPQDLASARIMTFGRRPDSILSVRGNSALRKLRRKLHHFSKTASDEVERQADALLQTIETSRAAKGDTTPIILLGHSLGGLVVKRFVANLKEERSVRNLAVHIKGVLFFGTPHRGTRLAYGSVFLYPWPKAAIFVSKLRPNSKYLLSLDRSFWDFAAQYRPDIASFYELKPMRYGCDGVSIPLFTAPLETTQLPAGKSFGLQADHSSIVKFGSRNDLNYQTVLSQLSLMAI